MAMKKKNCILDPGSWNFRFYSPNGKPVERLRTCYIEKDHQKITGQKAIEAYWSESGREIRYPWISGRAHMNIAPVFNDLMKQAKAEQMTVKPPLNIVLPQDADEKDRELLRNLGVEAGFRRITFSTTMELLGKELHLVIHAGHSATEIGVCRNRKPIIYKKIYYGASQMDDAIMDYVASKYKALLFTEDASALRIAASRAFREGRNPILSCTVLDQTGQYVRISFPAFELWPAIDSVESQIVLWARSLVAEKGVNMMERILRKPVLLSGGLADCFGLKEKLEAGLHCKVIVNEYGEDALIEAAANYRLF